MPEPKKESRMEQDERNTKIRRDTQIRGSLGYPPSGDEPKVTPEDDLFKDEDTRQSER